MAYPVKYCANGIKCKNITDNKASAPTVVRRGGPICAYCSKGADGFKKLKTEASLVASKGIDRRGRPRLKLSDADRRTRDLTQRAVAQLKIRKKTALLKELGSKKHPDWDDRWQEISNAVELKKSTLWGKAVGPKIFEKPRSQRASLAKGTTENGTWEWSVHEGAEGTFELSIRKIDHLTKSRSDSYLLKNLTETAYRSAIKKLEKSGISDLEVTYPFSAYKTKAIEFRLKFSKDQLSLKDIDNFNKNVTFGFLVALYLEHMPQGKTNMPRSRTVYRVIGDVKVPTSAGPLQQALDQWMEQLASAPLARKTRIGSKGGAKSKSTLSMLYNVLSGITRTLELYKSKLPWADGIALYVRGRLRHHIKDSLKTGNTAHGKGYRCLRQSEICEIFKAPTIHHVALVALAFSTGLRPEELSKLTTDHWNKESGTLHFSGGKLLSKKLAANDPKYLANPHTSTVVKFILTNEEFFDLDMRDEVVGWMQKQVKGKNNVMKGMPALQRIAAWTGTPVATMRDFRTTSAIMAHFCGRSVDKIKESMGHMSIATTTDSYLKGIPEDAGAFVHITDDKIRGAKYFNNPEVIWRDQDREHSYTEENAWDTFLLCQFLQQVLRFKTVEFKAQGLTEALAASAAKSYWQWELTKKLQRAINHVADAQEARQRRLPDQRFDPMFDSNVSAPDLDLPYPVQKTPAENGV